jgi:hypothetical protein
MPTLQVHYYHGEDIPAIRARLREIARELGYVNTRGRATGEGNIPRLLAAIAEGEYTIGRRSHRGSIS